MLFVEQPDVDLVGKACIIRPLPFENVGQESVITYSYFS